MSVLVIGQNRWGHADNLATAKRRFSQHGGKLSRSYTVVVFPAELAFKGVDEVGRVHWEGDGEPVITEVERNKK